MRVLSNINDTMRAAYKWLADNQLTEQQVKQRLELALIDNPAKNDLVYETMQSLREENLLHDEWLAQQIVRRYSHLSNALIFKKLLAKGLHPKLAELTIKNLAPEKSRAESLAQEKWQDFLIEGGEKCWDQIQRYLESRGFSTVLVTEIISEWGDLSSLAHR